MNLFDLTGKVALITGSTKGIGLAIASRMAEAGARVVISSRNQDACDEVAAQINAGGGHAVAIACNINYKEQLRNLVEKTVAQLGALWENPETYAATVSTYPLRRIGEPDEIAGAAIYLASSAGSFTTGQTIVVDGGGTIAS